MATVDWETTVGIMLMFEFLDDLHQDKLLRRALEGLGTLDGAPFTGEDESSQRFIAGGEMRRDRSVTLRHPWINDISGEEEGWIKLSVMGRRRRSPTYLFIAIIAGCGERAPDQQWSMGLDLLLGLIKATPPLAAFMNLADVDDENYRMFPDVEGILRSDFPDALPPVFYFDDARFGESPHSSWLSTLPAQRIAVLPRGKLIIALASPRENPAPEFLAALERAPSGPIRFIAPQLPS